MIMIINMNLIHSVEENEETIYNELDKLINNNTKSRGNIDGLIIEIMI
ncbi:hypothetical protein UM764_05470 [Staphylococcus aureus]|nr:hypothetical protein UM764_05470 [Staphylococcus aureus]WRN72818.1 hypothetical protein UM582_01955 [Staphylococcus aureus]